MTVNCCCGKCSTPGQRVVKRGIKLSLNMAPEAKTATRRLGLSLFLHKNTALNVFGDTYEVSNRGSVLDCFVIISCGWLSGLAVRKTLNVRGKQF